MSPNASDLDHLTRILAETAPATDATGEFPWRAIEAVHRSGLLECTVSDAFGGRSATLGDLVRVLVALGRGDPSAALICSMTMLTHRNQTTRQAWPEAVYRRVLDESRRRPVLINAARAEPELGSPARGGLPETLARRTGDGWSISGRKMFVTGAEGLSYILVWARTDEDRPRIGTFIVPGGLPGIRIVPTWRSLGMRATGTHDVVFSDVHVPAENVMGLVEPSAAVQDNLANAAGNLAICAIYVGVAEAAQAVFHRFAHERAPANLGAPLASTQRFVTIAGEIDLLVSGARQLVFAAADSASPEPRSLIRARLLAGRQIQEAVGIAVKALGNPGLSLHGEMERHFRNIQSVLVHAPQEDTAVTVLGRIALAEAQEAR